MTLNKLALGASTHVVSGTLTAVNDSVADAVDALEYQSVSVQLTGTWSGTIVWETSNDGTTWVSKNLMIANSGSAPVNTTSNGIFTADLGARYFRVRRTVATSGTATATVVFSSASQNVLLATQPISGTVTATIAAGPTTIAKAEDAAHAANDVGVFTLGVRKDNPTVDTSADGDYGAMKIDRHGAAYMRTIDSAKRTYAAAALFTPVTGIVFEFSGAAAPTVIEINRLTLTLFGTAAGAVTFQVVKNSALSTAGTAVAMTKVPYDSADAASVATARYFTAAPTAGTAIGPVRQGYLAVPAANQPSDRFRIESGSYSKSMTLLSATQAFTVILAGTLPTGAQLALDIEWTEY